MGCNCGLTLKRWFCIFMLLSIILIIAGLVFIIFGGVNYESKSNERRWQNADRVGAVIDAGGSATRLTLYAYRENTKSFRQIGNGKPFVCEDKGIDYYTDGTYAELERKISDCLDMPFANGWIPGEKKVPLYFAATGGMRLLQKRDETLFNATLERVRGVLNRSKFDIKYADVISGDNEAFWDWWALNSEQKKDNRRGVIDFGSSSVQMVFEPAPPVDTKAHPANLKEVKMVDGDTTTLYSNSYLCFGTSEVERRTAANLVKSSGYKMVTDYPCYFTGYERNFTADELFQSPCVTGQYARDVLGGSIDPPTNATTDVYTLRGTSDQSACSQSIRDVINLQCNSPGNTCGMNGVYQPPPHGKFLGKSTIYYTAQFMGILDTGAGLPEYKQKRDEICAKTWSQTKKDKYAGRRCFDASYTYFVMTEGFKFPESSTNIEFKQQTDGLTVQWSLGLIRTKLDEMYKRRGFPADYVVIKRSPNYIVLIVVGIIFIIIGAILLVCALKARRNKREPVMTADS